MTRVFLLPVTFFSLWLGAGSAQALDEVRLQVPFMAQAADRDCGPTSLLILLRWAGYRVTRSDVAFLGTRSLGTLPVHIERWLARHEIPYRRLPGRRSELVRLLDRGLPLLVLWNRSRGRLRNFHYAVVVGYRAAPSGAIESLQVHDGKTPYREVPWHRFKDWWERAGYWNVYLPLKPSGRP